MHSGCGFVHDGSRLPTVDPEHLHLSFTSPFPTLPRCRSPLFCAAMPRLRRRDRVSGLSPAGRSGGATGGTGRRRQLLVGRSIIIARCIGTNCRNNVPKQGGDVVGDPKRRLRLRIGRGEEHATSAVVGWASSMPRRGGGAHRGRRRWMSWHARIPTTCLSAKRRELGAGAALGSGDSRFSIWQASSL